MSEAPTTTETLTKAAGGLLSTMGFGGLRKTFWSKDQQQNESIENAPSKRSRSKESKSKTEAPRKEESKSGINQTQPKPKNQTMRISKVLAQNIIFNTTSQFICYFVNLKLPFDSSRDLLMHFCKKYELD